MAFPGVAEIGIAADGWTERFDAAIIMECGDLTRTGVAGLDQFFVINIDHHPGNTGYGRINWFDPTAAACGEMVFELVRALGVPLSVEIATHIYLAILTDTGSFHYSSISPRTFDICRQALEAGVDPVLVARHVYDSNNMGRLRLFGAVLSAMQLDATGRIAMVYLDHEMARAAGRHLRGHRRADQPAADGQGDPGGRLLQADRGRAVPGQPAVQGRRRHRRGRHGVRRRRPQERRRMHGERRHRCAAGALRRQDGEAIDRMRSEEVRRRAPSLTSRRARPRTTSSRVRAARSASVASATPARSIPPRAACCRWSSAARRGWRDS